MLYAGSYCAVLQIHRVDPRTKIHQQDPSIDRRINIFRRLEQVFDPCPMMFKDLKGWGGGGERKQFPSQCSANKRKEKQ
jgi:hypothetical protein